MEKIFCLILCAFIFSMCLSACNMKQTSSMVKSERRFAKYVEVQDNKTDNVVDLSEGPKLKYDAVFGPKTPSFEFKIVNPY